jgi:hypothetical protein
MNDMACKLWCMLLVLVNLTSRYKTPSVLALLDEMLYVRARGSCISTAIAPRLWPGEDRQISNNSAQQSATVRSTVSILL